MSDSPAPTLQAMLVHLSEVGSDWFVFGIALGVPISKLRSIEVSYSKEGVKRWITEMLQYWLDTTPAARWQQVTAALEQVDLITLASRIKQKYLWDHPEAVVKNEGVSSSSSSSSSATTAITAAELTRSPPPPPSPASQSAELSSDATAEIKTDRKIVEELRDLVSDYSLMLTRFRRLLAGCDISEARFFLDTLFEPDHDIFTSCANIEQLLKQLCHRYVDTFNVYYLQKLATCLERDDVIQLVKQYEEKKDNFLKETTVLNFHKAIISKAPVSPKGMAKITIRIPKELATNRILKDMEELAIKAFGDSYCRFVQFHVIAGSVVICWFVVESLCEVLQQLAREKVAVWRQHGVEEVMVGSQCVYCSSSKKEEVHVVKQYHYYSQAKEIEKDESGDLDVTTLKTEELNVPDIPATNDLLEVTQPTGALYHFRQLFDMISVHKNVIESEITSMQEQLSHFQLESKELSKKNQHLEERVDVLLEELKEMEGVNSTLKSKNADLEEELEAVVQAAGVHMDEEEEMEKKKDDIKVYEDLLSQAFADNLKYNKAVQLLLHSDLLLSDKEAYLEEGQIKDPRDRAHLLLKALHVEEKPNALIQFLKSDEELKSLAEDISAEVIKPGLRVDQIKLVLSKQAAVITHLTEERKHLANEKDDLEREYHEHQQIQKRELEELQQKVKELQQKVEEPQQKPSSLSKESVPSQREFYQTVILAVPDRWYAFGTSLSIPTSDLMDIKADHIEPELCFLEVYKKWEMKGEPPFSWKTVYVILKSFGERRLMKEIQKSYDVGCLSVYDT